MSTGADFTEIYYEERKTVDYRLIDSKLDTIDAKNKTNIFTHINKRYFHSQMTNNKNLS